MRRRCTSLARSASTGGRLGAHGTGNGEDAWSEDGEGIMQDPNAAAARATRGGPRRTCTRRRAVLMRERRGRSGESGIPWMGEPLALGDSIAVIYGVEGSLLDDAAVFPTWRSGGRGLDVVNHRRDDGGLGDSRSCARAEARAEVGSIRRTESRAQCARAWATVRGASDCRAAAPCPCPCLCFCRPEPGDARAGAPVRISASETRYGQRWRA
ncbi:hypothetical protein C8R44DRAFT_341274 [Mycena epipterygia]|nr:hypothetical protein C8R44DRAFT_341274 [Mycena epipterygia]